MSVSAQTRGKALTVRCVREKDVNVCWPTSIFSVDRFFLVHSISHKPRPKLIIPCARGTRLCPGHSVPRVMSVESHDWGEHAGKSWTTLEGYGGFYV